MADEGFGTVTLPKRITLGNLLSIAITVVVGAFIIGTIWALLGYRVNALEVTVAGFPSEYAHASDLTRVTEDRNTDAAAFREATAAIQKQAADLTASISSLSAQIGDMKDNLDYLRRSIDHIGNRISDPSEANK